MTVKTKYKLYINWTVHCTQYTMDLTDQNSVHKRQTNGDDLCEKIVDSNNLAKKHKIFE